jgi:hypothetical protein
MTRECYQVCPATPSVLLLRVSDARKKAREISGRKNERKGERKSPEENQSQDWHDLQSRGEKSAEGESKKGVLSGLGTTTEQSRGVQGSAVLS